MSPMSIDVEIPSKGKPILKFTQDELSYKDTTIKYKDINAISCYMQSISVYYLPAEENYFFEFYGNEEKIEISFTTSFNLFFNQEEVFGKIFSLSKRLFVPEIVSDLVDRIINKNETIQIGNVYFNKEGYYKKRFLKKDKWLLWKDNMINPQMFQGGYLLGSGGNGKLKQFANISLATKNGIVIPELVQNLGSILR